MPRRFTEPKLVVASHNAGKVRELAALLENVPVEIVSAGELGLAEPEETGDSYRANAELKARAACVASGLPALADDSGLSVDALGGKPGIHSARWAGPDRDFDHAMQKVEAGLQEAGASEPGRRSAAFVAGLCLAWPDGHVEYVEGRVHGTLIWPPRGTNGFGYDPMFLPDGHDRTFGEMNADEKHGWARGEEALSHRARAFQMLIEACFA